MVKNSILDTDILSELKRLTHMQLVYSSGNHIGIAQRRCYKDPQYGPVHPRRNDCDPACIVANEELQQTIVRLIWHSFMQQIMIAVCCVRNFSSNEIIEYRANDLIKEMRIVTLYDESLNPFVYNGITSCDKEKDIIFINECKTDVDKLTKLIASHNDSFDLWSFDNSLITFGEEICNVLSKILICLYKK